MNDFLLDFNKRWSITIDQNNETTFREFKQRVNYAYIDLIKRVEGESVSLYNVFIERINIDFCKCLGIPFNAIPFYIENAKSLIIIYKYIEVILHLGFQQDRKKIFRCDIEQALRLCNIQVNFTKEKFYPSGARLLDEKLVNDNLNWLNDYDNAYQEYEKALRLYMLGEDIRLIVDSLRLCLETFLKEFFNKNKHLDNIKTDYRQFLKQRGIAIEIRNMFESAISFYIEYNNDKAKHNNKVYEQEVEFLIYQTGVFLRMFITLKDAEIIEP